MGWPRTNKPNTSAQTNAEVEGAQRSVADSPVNEELAEPEPSGAKVVPGSVVEGDGEAPSEAEGYDETSGIVYEVQPRGFEIIGLGGTEDPGPDAEEPAPAAEDPVAEEPAAEDRAAEDPVAEEPAAEDPVAEKPPPPHNTGPRPVWNKSLLSDSVPSSGRRDRSDNPFGRIFRRRESGGARGVGEAPLTRFRDLPLDEKMRLWRMRALIVVVVGVVFTLISNVEVGITLAIIAGIADTIYRSRSVESHAYTPRGTVDRATWRAQRRTMKQLAGMERSGYVALNKRPIPDSVEVIDHLVIGPTGVYAIDSEKWDKDLPIRQSNGKKLWLGPESKTERLEHARWEARQASQRLSEQIGMDITVQPALAIYGPKISWIVLPVSGVDVFSGDHLKNYLRRRARRKDMTPLTAEQIQTIYEAASDVLPVEWHGEVTPVG